MSYYPPGVTGNEPQITGEWPCDECDGLGYDVDEDGKHGCPVCEAKGYVTGEEDYYQHKYVCSECSEPAVEWDDEAFRCPRCENSYTITQIAYGDLDKAPPVRDDL